MRTEGGKSKLSYFLRAVTFKRRSRNESKKKKINKTQLTVEIEIATVTKDSDKAIDRDSFPVTPQKIYILLPLWHTFIYIHTHTHIYI